ncbi:MAG TPA: hypothetical protein VEB59_11620 [Gemmatimonadales bacterium]|nr:hypothetical protein [Gemmatimonadales bacterium]
MKKLLLMAGVLALAACGEKKAEAPAGETTGEMAPATADTGMGMSSDTGMMHSDSTMARDSAAH